MKKEKPKVYETSDKYLQWLKEDTHKFKYDYINKMSRYSIQYWVERYKRKFKKRSLFLIQMLLRNDKYDTFTIATNSRSFTHRGGLYFIDPDLVREDLHSKLNTLGYHQDCSIPFKVEFNLDKLRKATSGEDQIQKALNPISLKGFIESSIIEKVMKGQELTDDMQYLKKLIMINLIISVVVGLMVAKAMGWI